MERRRFLKLVGLAAIAAVPTTVGLATALAPAAYATLGGMAYRAEGGRVFVSRDGGQTWAQHSDLGPDLSVTGMSVVGGALRMAMRYAGRTFRLTLAADGRHWLTA